MAPNTKGPMFSWLDPSRLYCNSQAFADCVEDLLSPFQKDSIDLVAGIDAMGFILGVRVLLVDQWIETGGTMKAAVQLIEGQGATVAGIATVAIENTEGGKWIKDNYRFSHCIPEELQSHIDGKDLNSLIQKLQKLSN